MTSPSYPPTLLVVGSRSPSSARKNIEIHQHHQKLDDLCIIRLSLSLISSHINKLVYCIFFNLGVVGPGNQGDPSGMGGIDNLGGSGVFGGLDGLDAGWSW